MKNIKKLLSMLLCAAMIIGTASCAQKEVNSTGGKMVTLKWYFPCATQEDNALVFEKANELIGEKLNIRVDFIPIDFGSFDQKMQVVNAARDNYDLVFTSNWLNNYYQNVEKGNIKAISEEELKEYAPDLYESINPRLWDGVRVKGEIYGIINQQIFARQAGLYIPEVFREKYNINLDSLTSYDGIENYLKTIHENEPEANQLGGLWHTLRNYYGFELFMGTDLPVAINYKKEGVPQVFNIYDTDEYRKYIHNKRKWMDEGLIADILEETSSSAVDQVKNDKIMNPISSLDTYKPGVEDEMFSLTNIYPAIKLVDQPLLTSTSVTSTLTSISDTSEHVEECLKLLNYINTDKEIYNLLSFGIEGRHYTKVSDNRIEINKDNQYIVANWALGNVFNAYLYGNQADDTWEQTKKINDSAVFSPLFGFAPDMENITVETANCQTVVKEYSERMEQKIGDLDADYEEYMSKLKTAGIDKIINEMQDQINKWWEENKK